MNKGVYLLDKSGDSFATLFQAEKILFETRSEFQKIMVFESEQFGRSLMLDDIFNVSPVMEAFYHEPMAHIPLAMPKEKKDVLIIGGGDFGVAFHALKHKDLKRLTLCELDPEVISVCRKYFPEWAACEKDPRMNLHVGDGMAYLRDSPDKSLDAVIVDSTDPFECADILISDEFYQEAARSLKDDGVLMQIMADHVLYKEVWPMVIPRVRQEFKSVYPLFLPIPFYAAGVWGLMIAGKEGADIRPEKVSRDYLEKIPELQTLTPEGVCGWFALPPFFKREFKNILEN